MGFGGSAPPRSISARSARARSAQFFEYELKPWDFAAGTLFVEEAGGRVSTCRGEELPLAPGPVLASNGHLHPAMLEILAAHMPPPRIVENPAEPPSEGDEVGEFV